MHFLLVFFAVQHISYSQTKPQIDSLFLRIYEVPAVAAAENSDIFSDAAVAVFNNNSAFDFSGVNGLNYYHFDKEFILLNWGVPEEDGTISYRGLLWGWNSSQKEYRLQVLNDISSYQSFPEKEVYTPENWWGAFYYDCIVSGGGTDVFYTLLGWNSSQPLYSQKVIETMRIKATGEAEFGLPVFRSASGAIMRKFNIDAASTDYYAIEKSTAKSRSAHTKSAPAAPLSEDSDFIANETNTTYAATSKQKPVRRIVFRFSRKHDMILRYDHQTYIDKSGSKSKQRKENMIIFDRILPRDASLSQF
jgi:hypothetical protein